METGFAVCINYLIDLFDMLNWTFDIIGTHVHIDRMQDSLWKSSSILLDKIELRTQLNQFEIFEEHWKLSVLEENHVDLNENRVEGKPFINRSIKSLELNI